MKKKVFPLLIAAIVLILAATGLILAAAGLFPRNLIIRNQSHTAQTEASDTPAPIDTRQDALHAYQDILSQDKWANEEEDICMPYFAVSDLDADDMPELILSEGSNVLDSKYYYTYEDGKVVEIESPGEDEDYPVYGGLYPQPDKGTYVFYRGGPAYEDDTGEGGTPYTLCEYQIQNHQIHMINHADWIQYDLGDKAGTTEYTLNDKPCSAEEIEGQYTYEEQIEFLPNTEANRKTIGQPRDGATDDDTSPDTTEQPDEQGE